MKTWLWAGATNEKGEPIKTRDDYLRARKVYTADGHLMKDDGKRYAPN